MKICLTISLFEPRWDRPYSPFVHSKKKRCYVCQKRKRRIEFYKSPGNYDGLTDYCKDCK